MNTKLNAVSYTLAAIAGLLFVSGAIILTGDAVMPHE